MNKKNMAKNSPTQKRGKRPQLSTGHIPSVADREDPDMFTNPDRSVSAAQEQFV